MPTTMAMRAKTGPLDVETNVRIAPCNDGHWHIHLEFDCGLTFASPGFDTEGEARAAFIVWRDALGAEQMTLQ